MAYKHYKVDEHVLSVECIPYTIPTAGHYKVQHPVSLEELVWFPKSCKIQVVPDAGKQVTKDMPNRAAAINYIKQWLAKVE